MQSTEVTGYCPMGCGRTLFLAAGGRVTCRHVDCPAPCAVDDLLDDRETEHVVEFADTVFTVRHPLRERLGDQLMACELHQYIADLPGPPVVPGRYRARADGDRWSWELIGPSGVVPAGGDADDR
ncbi:DUF6085 family protein [Pseudonocardia sp. NPDC049635]|uniref:DUF6085 family protein n=1 Tax=Pseudonocardia sp. NPDC049635 TaxID=3155506 RepID=UPI0033C8474F